MSSQFVLNQCKLITATGLCVSGILGLLYDNYSQPTPSFAGNDFRDQIQRYARDPSLSTYVTHNIYHVDYNVWQRVNHSRRSHPEWFQDIYHQCERLRVPEIVHLVWLYGQPRQLAFYQLLSMISIVKVIRPKVILFWYDGHRPTGQWWTEFMKAAKQYEVPIRFCVIVRPNHVHRKRIVFPEHSTDIVRLHVLREFGGAYCDSDVLAVRSWRSLFCYDVAIGQETQVGLGNGVILAVPNASFIQLWLDSFKKYRPYSWAYNSIRVPFKLWKRHPELIHVEKTSINHPNWQDDELKYIYDSSLTFNWSENFAIHLWSHKMKKIGKIQLYDADNIKHINSTFGQVARLIYYGSSNVTRIGV